MSYRALSLAVAFIACAASAGAAPPGAAPPEAPMVGGDSDAHGCKASAGYTYSTLKTRCIRLWEDGVRLDPVKPEGSAVISAFVVFAHGRSGPVAELFLPSGKATPPLKKTGRAWTGGGYRLTRKGSIFTVADAQGHALYRGQ